MYVCICNAVTERQIKHACDEGACSMRALREQLGVASCCGRCAACAHDVLCRCRAESAQAAENAQINAQMDVQTDAPIETDSAATSPASLPILREAASVG